MADIFKNMPESSAQEKVVDGLSVGRSETLPPAGSLGMIESYWARKWIFLGIFILSNLFAVTWLHITQPLYTARMVVGAQAEGSRGSSIGDALGGMAALSGLGIKLPQSSDSPIFSQYRHHFTSTKLANRLQDERQVLQQIFESIWDQDAGVWRRPSGLIFSLKSFVKKVLAMPEWRQPTTETLSFFLKGNIRLSEIQGTPFYSITMVHEDPKFAKEMLTWIDLTLDSLLRAETRLRVSAQIKYLEGRLRTIKEIEVRETLAELLVEQEKVKMMLDIDLPFAADIIEPPTVNSTPTYPSPLLVITLFWLIGIVIFVTFVHFSSGRKAVL